MRLTLLWAGGLFVALVSAACGNDGDAGSPNGPCGTNGACPSGFTCEPRTNICLPNSTHDAGSGDAGPIPDASGVDAGPTPDTGTGNHPDSGPTPDAGPTGTAPVTTITPQFTSPVNTRAVSFTLTSSIPGSTFECSIDGGSFDGCGSAFATTLGTDGAHTLEARATAPGGATELNPPRLPFVIDTAAPIITINSPADGATVGNSTLVYSSNESVRSFQCSFDGADPMACGSGLLGSIPIPIALANGPHTAIVTGTDLAGNPGSDSISFTFDIVVLGVSINARQTACANESIAFAASQPGATFSCSLDGTVTDPCTSPFALPLNVPGGNHMFAVTATLGSATATNSLTFTVDRTVPSVDILGILPGNQNDMFGNYDPSGTVFFTTNKPAGMAECAIDGSPTDCSTSSGEGLFTYFGLDDSGNPHEATVSVSDVCGGPDVMTSFSFSVDSTPPAPCFTDVRTTNGPDIANGGACLAPTPKSGTTGSLTFASEKGSYTCTMSTVVPAGKLPGGPPVTTIGPFNCIPGTPIPFANLTDFGGNGRVWTLSISGLDIHGNHSVTRLDWTVDATPPHVLVGAATPNAAAGTLQVAFTVTPALDVTEGVTFPTCTLDGNACACANGVMTCQQVSAGDHVAQIQARDHWANTGGTATNANPLVMTYGPNSGRLILIGHDFDIENGNTTALLTAALTDVPGVMSGTFTRKPRVLWFAPATGNDAAFANVSTAWASVIDTAGSNAFTDATKIDSELPDHDVLFVFDQNSPGTSTTIGTLWNTVTSGGETHLTHFLNNGGIVIVLDGLAGNVTSDTWHVVAQGNNRAIDVVSSSNATSDEVFYEAALAETLDPTAASDLFIRDSYTAPANSVGFDLSQAEIQNGQARVVYDESCECFPPPGVVYEKVFPVYAMSVVTTTVNLPGGDMQFAITPATTGTTTCVLEFESGTNPCGGQNNICACTPGSGTSFKFPVTSGNYLMEFLHRDPAGRPGRLLSVGVTTSLTLDVGQSPISTQNGLVVCLEVRPQSLNPPVNYLLDNETPNLDDPIDPACAGFDASRTFDQCEQGDRTFTAVDAKGATSNDVTVTFNGCGGIR